MDTLVVTDETYRKVVEEIRAYLVASLRWPRSASGKNTATYNRAREMGYNVADAVWLGEYWEQMYD